MFILLNLVFKKLIKLINLIFIFFTLTCLSKPEGQILLIFYLFNVHIKHILLISFSFSVAALFKAP